MSGKRVVGWRVKDKSDGLYVERYHRGDWGWSRTPPRGIGKREARALRDEVRAFFDREVRCHDFVAANLRLVRVVKGGAR